MLACLRIVLRECNFAAVSSCDVAARSKADAATGTRRHDHKGRTRVARGVAQHRRRVLAGRQRRLEAERIAAASIALWHQGRSKTKKPPAAGRGFVSNPVWSVPAPWPREGGVAETIVQAGLEDMALVIEDTGGKVVATHHVVLKFGRPIVTQSIFRAEAKHPAAGRLVKRPVPAYQ